jgi:hypothetical protein
MSASCSRSLTITPRSRCSQPSPWL